ncbi:MAG: NADH-ubiquinone oxidoreductase-F iron-sulfur binding region domain-containing protein [Candidatus Omnitrophota bacterium]
MSDKRTGSIIFSHIEPFAGLNAALSKTKIDILSEVRNSNLRGRGGAGFPTGIKWNLAASAKEEKKYVVCNADEGEPGTFKDRVLLTEMPEILFEGMTIAAYAIGADEGLVYLRGEYSSFFPRLEKVLQDMRAAGRLGKDILGKTGFNFDIQIRMGAGAYVCGEETALIESMEGQRGEPRNRPPFPVNTGYNGYPTIVNNIETFVNVPHIILKGAEWFKGFGTEKSAGTKLLSVSGDCKAPGVYEVEYGTSIRDVLAMVGGENVKAVQVGGASGVCLSAGEFDRKIAFEDVPTGGSFIVFNQQRDMLGAAENFLEFFKEESCGQCTPCREGIPVLIDGLKKIRAGQCRVEYVDDLLSLCETMQMASKCGLGQSVPNAFLSILKNFKNEYELVSSNK